MEQKNQTPIKDLLRNTELIRENSLNEALETVKALADKDGIGCKLIEAKIRYKNKKLKGEIVDEWYVVTATVDYEV